jgi:hypothetical protein
MSWPRQYEQTSFEWILMYIGFLKTTIHPKETTLPQKDYAYLNKTTLPQTGFTTSKRLHYLKKTALPQKDYTTSKSLHCSCVFKQQVPLFIVPACVWTHQHYLFQTCGRTEVRHLMFETGGFLWEWDFRPVLRAHVVSKIDSPKAWLPHTQSSIVAHVVVLRYAYSS